MNLKQTLCVGGMIALLTISLVGCNSEASYSPQEIIDQALQETKELESYYGEYTMDIDETGVATVKEWMKDGKRRIEMTVDDDHVIAVNDGKQITTFSKKENKASIMTFENGELEELMGKSAKDSAQVLLNIVKDSHDISIAGEEKIAGRDAYHITAKAQKKNTLLGDIEVWIDKKTWLTLKTITTNAGNVTQQEYTKLEVNKKIDDALFAFDIPKGATIEQIDTLDQTAPTTLDEVKKQLGDFLLLPEENGLTLSTILDMKVEERPEFSFEYEKDEQPAFSVSVFKVVSNYQTLGGNLANEEDIQVRGVKGTYMDLGELFVITWYENGYEYSIITENPELTKEEILAYAEEMTIVQ
ncbi:MULTISPECIES: outer membrane lipoprotein carrier protein LolA [unclassified Lysinibacillus]|uniref:LolA family protein n=1 Tax=unclassified Lysinibacillus TaxID=2636778 RepID=UPI00382E8AAA